MDKKGMSIISVLIPVYNSRKTIRETIDSVLGQTFPEFELLLMDDGSTDDSAEIIQSYTDSRIRYIPCSHHFVETLNRGIDTAQGKYIALLDHDDLMLPHRLKVQYEFMEEHPDVIACGGYMHAFGMYSYLMKESLDYADIATDAIYRCPMLNPTGFIRRSVLQSHNLRYSDGYSFSADFKLWTDLIQVGKVVNIPEVLTLYRTYPEQTSLKYLSESQEGANKIRIEMIEYFLTLVKKESEYYSLLMDTFIPALDKLGETAIFSSQTLFPFLHELITGLVKRGDIELEH